MIPVYKPYLTQKSLKYAHDAIDSTWISSIGKYVKISEERLKDILDVKHVKLVNNGTSATHLVAKALLFRNPKIKNIIVPNNVYVAAWNAFLYENLNIIPIDACIKTWNMDYKYIPDYLSESTGICLVNNLGNINDVRKIIKKYGKEKIVEDNCEGFLGINDNKKAGTLSLASSLSFFGNKNITSGEGGAFVTNDSEVFEYINSLQGQGQSKDKRYIHDKLGYNYRITNVQAAILLGQLDSLKEISDNKERVFNLYRKKFLNIKNVRIQKQEVNTKHSNWMMGIRILNNTSYENAKNFFLKHKIETRPMFYPISYHAHTKKYSNLNNEFIATKLSKECIILPSYPSLKESEINYIVKTVLEYIETLN